MGVVIGVVVVVVFPRVEQRLLDLALVVAHHVRVREPRQRLDLPQRTHERRRLRAAGACQSGAP